ncbi:MAG: hypothetical protein RL662_360 [Bacteroidota bacterium]|jgi:para-aminobenzoate synthetase component 1
MRITDIDNLCCQLNECGKQAIPFLFAINFEMTEGLLIKNPEDQEKILFQTPNAGNKSISANKRIGELKKYPIGKSAYEQKFEIVSKALHRGDSFLTNLTIKTAIESNLSLAEIFELSNAPYQLLYPNRFVCFSPERFVRIANGNISTNPMKGTIDASIDNAEQLILADFKETAEHSTIVDLLRNDLSMVADNVGVDRFRYIEPIRTKEKTLLQVSSEITGILPFDYQDRLGDILFKLLPAGSVSGAPKTSTLHIIQQAEQEPRGYYTGIFGYFDGQVLDSAVMIRFIEQDGDHLFFRSGGGITVYSKCADEYKEVLDKIYLPFL